MGGPESRYLLDFVKYLARNRMREPGNEAQRDTWTSTDHCVVGYHSNKSTVRLDSCWNAFDFLPPPNVQCRCLPRPAPPSRPRDATSSAWKGHRPAAGQATVSRPFGSRYNISHTNTCTREGAVLDNPATGTS
ncbi:hypothetical protein CORC01_04429 [Colletotrichum orchidophilum]|uniref:Uncharacterized protein n=1 Tax=Colletotrichum orchidophilum TaxID=1209926 RepID=A0A1G4BFG0_9PEZI|nr:uncharacterized protein CORC01_04429 [Colletotrichum orchidophilum]OHF00240.1 hypothetical protein CORC01_04429 [Colletotrichum orchidophilum]